MNSKKINVLVTGIGGAGHGEQIIKALRLSKGLNLCLIGTDAIEDTSGKVLVDIFYKVPYANEASYGKKIFDIIKKHNVKFMFHGSEPELKFMSEHRKELSKLQVGHPLNDGGLVTLCMNKYRLYKKLKELGISVPRFWKIDSEKDVRQVKSFPVVLKPNTCSGGSVHVHIAFDKEDLKLLAKYMLKLKIDLVAQEYIASERKEYTIGVSATQQGNVLGSIAIKRAITNTLTTKLKINHNGRLYALSSGISQGEVCHVPALQSQAEHMARKLNSKGPLNIQCRSVRGKLMLLEINPRLSGSTHVRALAGYNEPELMIKHYIFKKEWRVRYHDMKIMRTVSEIIL